MSHWNSHPGVRTGAALSRRERWAIAATNAIGSWTFIVVQTVVVAAWITLNVSAFVYRWDPYPFILLNLAFSTEAAYATPLILLGQASQDRRNAEQSNHMCQVVDRIESKIDDLAGMDSAARNDVVNSLPRQS